MWLPLFQATKDTCEENEQSKIIFQQSKICIIVWASYLKLYIEVIIIVEDIDREGKI